jgi:hypothetical protein
MLIQLLQYYRRRSYVIVIGSPGTTGTIVHSCVQAYRGKLVSHYSPLDYVPYQFFHLSIIATPSRGVKIFISTRIKDFARKYTWKSSL